MPAKGGIRAWAAFRYARCAVNLWWLLLAAWMLSHAEMGEARGRWVILKRKNQRSLEPMYNPTHVLLDHHCVYASLLRARGIRAPCLQEIIILRGLIARLWQCFPRELARVAQTSGMSQQQYCDGVCKQMWGGESRPVLYSVVWGVKICICVDFGFKATCGWNVIHHDFLRNQPCCEVGKASRPGPK